MTESTNKPTDFSSYKIHKLGHLEAGFDVHGNLAAAATDNKHVMIWDVKEGLTLVDAELDNCTCLQFVDETATSRALRLMAATNGDKIVELTW